MPNETYITKPITKQPHFVKRKKNTLYKQLAFTIPDSTLSAKYTPHGFVVKS